MPQAISRRTFWLILSMGAGVIALLGLRAHKAEREREELRKPGNPQPDAEQEALYERLRQVKEGMTIEQAEALMGSGQKGTIGREECLAWDYQGKVRAVKVYVKVKEGKVSFVSTRLREGEGLPFRPKPRP